MIETPDNTIVAISTPPGSGAIGIIRLSGSVAHEIAEKFCFRADQKKFREMMTFHLYRCLIKKDDCQIDNAMVVIMKAPHSYTGEDMVEIHCHGGRSIMGYIIKLALNSGAVAALPGQFTQRAFLNGKLDLTQAESVAWLIESKSIKEIESAAAQLKGDLKADLQRLETGLLKVIALIEVHLDFIEYEGKNIPGDEVKRLLKLSLKQLREIEREAETGNLEKNGINLVIVGKPNVGKSSLLNRFLAEKRAIVSKIPGTTRDTIEEAIIIEGIPIKIIDTAGIRKPREEIEREGVKRAKRKIKGADLVLLVMDRATELTEEDRIIIKLLEDKNALMVINKSDLPDVINCSNIFQEFQHRRVVEISARKRWGLNRLKKEILDAIRPGTGEDAGILISGSRLSYLREARESVEKALENREEGYSEEIIAMDLHRALQKIKMILGEEYDDDLLKEIFANFCVGK